MRLFFVMTDIKHMLKNNNSFLSDKIKKLAEPLNTFFSIDEFIYNYISDEGDFFAISNQSEPSEYYYHHNFYQFSLFFLHPDNYSNGAVLPSVIDQGVKNEQIKNIMESKFGYSAETMLGIFKKDKHAVHKFLFNTKNKNLPITSFYLKNLQLLDSFCGHFLSEWKAYRKEMEKYTINIAELIGPKFFNISMPGQLSGEFDRKQDFLKRLGILPIDFKSPTPFSAQEKACLEHMSMGKTIKETAEIMDLSMRTVEHYIDNIKNKMGCMTKSEVMETLHHLKLLGIY